MKHCKITHWAMHMGIAGLACAWKLCAQITLCSDTPWHVIAVTGAALNSIWTLLYFAKCFRYPQRVCKEWCASLLERVGSLCSTSNAPAPQPRP